MSGTGATSAINLDLDKDGIIDTRINLLAFSESGRHGKGGKLNTAPGFSLSLSTINPTSRGRISMDNGKTHIDPRYLETSADQKLARATLQKGMELLETTQFSKIIDEIESHSLICSDPNQFIYSNFFSGHHFIGGTSDLVNCDFSLGKFKNLFVCDASILNSFPASNIHAPIVILGALLGNRLCQI